MNLTYASGVYCLKTEQVLPISISEAWNFFSSPKNLQTITPDDLNFEITNGEPEQMFAGQLITYKINIFPLISSNWTTEITHVQENKYFIDEQRFGPYKLWHHKHSFTELGDQVFMKDEVHFKLPFGFLGRLFFPILIKPKLQHIFNFRYKKLETLFGKPKDNKNNSTTKPMEELSSL